MLRSVLSNDRKVGQTIRSVISNSIAEVCLALNVARIVLFITSQKFKFHWEIKLSPKELALVTELGTFKEENLAKMMLEPIDQAQSRLKSE